MRAISDLSREPGTSTRWCLAAAALRMHVRKSAMGSVCIFLLNNLPASFRDAGNFTFERHPAETDSTHLELANVPARAATNAAAITHTNLELWLLQTFGDFC